MKEINDAHCWTTKCDSSLFKGTATLYMKDQDLSKNGVFQSQIWQGKNRVFTLHVQGKFLRKPKGPICFYLAALDDNTTLGLISKRLGKMWLAFARNWEKAVDINFKNQPGKPLALIAPISSGWMGCLETKPGEQLPAVGHRLPTYKECVAQNGRDLGHLEDPDLECTYTFEYYTANLDTFRWVLTSIPVLPEISLHRLAPEFHGVPGTSGFFGCLREMGSEETKFDRHGDADVITTCQVIRREKAE